MKFLHTPMFNMPIYTLRYNFVHELTSCWEISRRRQEFSRVGGARIMQASRTVAPQNLFLSIWGLFGFAFISAFRPLSRSTLNQQPSSQKPSVMSGPSKAFRQNDQMCKLEKKNQAVSCVDSRKESLTCLVKHAEKKNKSQICQPFFDTYKACIKRQADKLKADRIAARGGSRW